VFTFALSVPRGAVLVSRPVLEFSSFYANCRVILAEFSSACLERISTASLREKRRRPHFSSVRRIHPCWSSSVSFSIMIGCPAVRKLTSLTKVSDRKTCSNSKCLDCQKIQIIELSGKKLKGSSLSFFSPRWKNSLSRDKFIDFQWQSFGADKCRSRWEREAQFTIYTVKYTNMWQIAAP